MTGRRRTVPTSFLPALLLALALAPALAGCGLLDLGGDDEPGAAAPGTLLQDADALGGAVAAFLDDRAGDLRRGRTGAVLADVVDDRGAQREQRRYARNLAQLPLLTLRYDTDGARTAVEDGRVVVAVDLRLRLVDVDEAAVASPRDMVLVPDGPDALRLVSDTPAVADPAAGGAQPWDDRRIEVLTDQGVLGVFDDDSVEASGVVVPAAVAAADEVQELVPYDWAGDVLVYAPSDTQMLDAIDALPGGVADRLDGVAFTLPAAGGGTAGERVVLHPRMLDADAGTRDRLLRHELTHVALGPRDERIPTWLSEGVAEWVSVQPVPVEERLISSAALDAARAGVEDLPADDTFNSGPRSGANYGISWQVCEEIATVYGSDALWTLVDAMDLRGDRSPEQVLERVLGTSGPELATGAAERIVAAYG